MTPILVLNNCDFSSWSARKHGRYDFEMFCCDQIKLKMALLMKKAKNQTRKRSLAILRLLNCAILMVRRWSCFLNCGKCNGVSTFV